MKNRGMALVTGLLMLATIALLAISAAGSMTLQQHQAANFSDLRRAANGAAIAEFWALAWLYSRADHERDGSCLSGCTLPVAIHGEGGLPKAPELMTRTWWQTHATAATTEPVSGEHVGFADDGDGDGFWLIEEIQYALVESHEGIEGVGYYRIFARGDGKAPGSVVVSEAIIARPWGPAISAASFPPDRPASEFCAATPSTLPCGIKAWRKRR